MLREKLSITFIFAFLPPSPPAKMLRHPRWMQVSNIQSHGGLKNQLSTQVFFA